MKTNTDSINDSIGVNNSLIIMSIIAQEKGDTLLTNAIDASSCDIPVSDIKENTIWLNNGQPSGWIQLLLPVCITLIVVFLEKKVEKLYNNKRDREDRKRYRQTIIDWIRLIIPIENILSESLSGLSSSIAQSDDMQPERYAMPSTIPDKLGSLTVEQMMDAFLTDFKGDKEKCSFHIYNIISCLDFLSKTRDEITKAYDSYNKQSVLCCERWNTEISVFKQWKMQQDDAEIDRIVKMWAVGLICKKDSIQVHEKLVNDFFQWYGTTLDITPILIKMQNVLQQRRALSNGYSIVFSDLSKKIDFSLKQLSEACDFFGGENAYK